MELVRTPDFAAYVTRLMTRHHVPGIAVAVVQDDAVASAGFGKASLDPPVECTPESLFDVASASKSLTAAAVALLVDDESHPEVQYDAPMAKLLPGDFVMPGEDHGDVTVEDVLSHRTGMAAHDTSYLGCDADDPDDAASITRNLRNLSVVRPNRAGYIYCNMMYTVASYLVEKKSGLRFADFLEQRIFRPLQMRSTSLQPGAARAKGLGDRIATGYVWDDEAKTYEPTPWTDSPEAQGAGGIVTSVDDYVKWVKAVMNREPPITDAVYRGLVEKRILQDEDADEADDMDDDEADDFPLPDTPELYYAAGWEIRQYCGHMVVSHDGSEDGFRSNHFFVPDLRLGGVIVGNSNCAATVINMLTHRLIDETVRRQEGDAALQAYKHGSGSGSCSTCASDDGSGSGSDDGSDDEDEDGPERELMREHCPGLDAPQPLTRPLAAYTGRYWNPGYRAIRIAEADGGLVVDATDRSMGYKLRFKHLRDQTHFMAYLSERFVKGESPLKVEFVLEGDRAVRVGMCLEESVKDYIWFERKDG